MEAPGQELPGTHTERHGFLGEKEWASPKLVTYCAESARPGYLTCQAHEYLESSPDVMREKIKLLANLLKRSKGTILYTGAGISTASGIRDYATKAAQGLAFTNSSQSAKSDSDKTKKATTSKNQSVTISPLCARPTISHRVLVALHRAGLVKGWIQQNHDGLPQKAGLPQAAINEIHGAWFDPSNPVVKMGGNLRDDLYEGLLQWEQDADLCLVLGTSMAGMNADRVAVSAAERAQAGKALGTVIVNLQRTRRDGLASLRIFSRLDDAMVMLAEELGVPAAAYAEDDSAPAALTPSVPAEALRRHVFTVPYDERGRRVGGGGGRGGGGAAAAAAAAATTTLDLRPGTAVRVTAGRHAGKPAQVVGQRREGHYEIRVTDTTAGGGGTASTAILGLWWIEAAVTGAVPTLPVVNVPAGRSLRRPGPGPESESAASAGRGGSKGRPG